MSITKGHEEEIKEGIKELLKEISLTQPVKEIKDSITSLVSSLEPCFNYIKAHKEAIQQAYNIVLVEYKTRDGFWAIHDKELMKLLQDTSEDTYSEVIVSYYKDNNYAKIKELYDNWLEIRLISDRMEIISSCFNLMRKMNSYKDLYNVVIPTLTAQITGVKEDIFELIPNKEEIKSILKGEKGNEPSDNEVITEFLWRSEAKSIAIDCYTSVFSAVLLNRGRLNKLTEEDIEKYNKYRNKILHGDKEFLNYGTEENLVRSWLELDIIIKAYISVKELLQKEKV